MNNDLYFQYDNKTGEYLRLIIGKKKVTYKKLENEVWNEYNAAADIYKHDTDTLFNVYGIKKVTIIKPTLQVNQVMGGYVDDTDATTRTYSAVTLTQGELDTIAEDAVHNEAIQKLSRLDTDVPRGMEDLITYLDTHLAQFDKAELASEFPDLGDIITEKETERAKLKQGTELYQGGKKK